MSSRVIGLRVPDDLYQALEATRGEKSRTAYILELLSDSLGVKRPTASLENRIQDLESRLSAVERLLNADTSEPVVTPPVTAPVATPDTPPAVCPKCGGTTWNKSGWDRKGDPPKRRWECRSCGKRVSV